ncbi:PREDICTED: glycosyltransferase family 92 protein At1g27200-like [Nelumbo nucifera]|uniref:Glycosyltransferase family 92 protein n=1 Tax=Nelumbo nucifera TaxID=4432 RepID=A0A1U8AGF2_NELNU|nr:PREDICTED: glycosyltransferase family 92 protein At1g27200-like [Nelumbo nucifera]
MRRKIRTTLLSNFVFVVLFTSFSFYLSRRVFFYSEEARPSLDAVRKRFNNVYMNLAIVEDKRNRNRRVYSLNEFSPDAILMPDWEVLLVLSPLVNHLSSDTRDDYFCLFQNNAKTPAKPAGLLPFHHLKTFKCILPNSVRRLRPFYQPILTRSLKYWPGNDSESPELLRWNLITYESLSTEDDVILFVKGVNQRQGRNRSPSELRCVFGNDVTNGVRTEVTSSFQEVFRCRRPYEGPLIRLFPRSEEKIKVTLEVGEEKGVVPSVAYYQSTPQMLIGEEKSLLCACTMVYNVAKFLKEWVIYHSKLGVEKFILYDNGSDDGLEDVVEELVQEQYNVKTLFWPWSKTQEAGFSHCAVYAKDSCTWMMYVDVDEFVYSPSWLSSPYPSNQMLKSLLPSTSSSPWSSSEVWIDQLESDRRVGEIMIKCLEFGPSNQSSHPIQGVTQGYTCRTNGEQRHKSIVLLEAVDESLLNVIHHFQLKEGYRVKALTNEQGVVNHYKYQAWSEFKAKFRRRVSAYVVDWKQAMNPQSKDRTPGLGFAAIEPQGWANKFCEVNDSRLKMATERWFGFNSSTGYKMIWQY